MKKQIIYSSFVISFLFLVINSNPVFSAEQLPPILDFYPDCDFKVLKPYSLVWNATQKRDPERIKINMIEAIRQQALIDGADAVILKAFELKQPSASVKADTKLYFEQTSNKAFKFIYSADFIKHCKNLKLDMTKPTPLNTHAKKQSQDNFMIESTFDPIVMKTPSFKMLDYKAPQSNTVSVEMGVYGIKLGATQEEVIASFGTPSIETSVLQGELIFGYGRRHWLHFQNNRLVRISTSNTLFDDNILNLIPLRDFFDDFQWQINDSIKYKADSQAVCSSLKIKKSRIQHNEISFENSEQSFNLLFSSRKDLYNDENIYSLTGFNLQTNDYKPGKFTHFSNQAHLKIISKLYKELSTGTFENGPKTIDAIGATIGIIYLPNEEKANIYDGQLIVNTRRDAITKLHLVADVFSNNLLGNSVSDSWTLDNIAQGESFDETLAKLSKDAYASELEIEVDSNSYQANFIFNDNSNSNRLEEVEIVLY